MGKAITPEEVDSEALDFPSEPTRARGRQATEWAEELADQLAPLLKAGAPLRTGAEVRILAAQAGEIRNAAYDGVDHVVVPVVALVEGVIHAVNAPKPELVLAQEFAVGYLGWNGRPVVPNHPMRNGIQVSANDPAILEQEAIGQVFNAGLDIANKRLLMEAWINPVKAEKSEHGRALMERIRRKQPIEVSVGTFVLNEPTQGQFGDKRYASVWRQIIPDHLALLPEGTTGACSIKMGCGAFRPAQDGSLILISDPEWSGTITREQEARFKALMDGVDLRALKGAPDGNSKDDHPFTYCMTHVVPAIEDKKGAMDDPKAFCGWWKAQRTAEERDMRTAAEWEEDKHPRDKDGKFSGGPGGDGGEPKGKWSAPDRSIDVSKLPKPPKGKAPGYVRFEDTGKVVPVGNIDSDEDQVKAREIGGGPPTKDGYFPDFTTFDADGNETGGGGGPNSGEDTLKPKKRNAAAVDRAAFGQADEAEEQAELIGYQTMASMLGQSFKALTEAANTVKQLIADENDEAADTSFAGEAAETTLEQARLRAVVAQCSQAIGSINGVQQMAYGLLGPSPVNSVAGYEGKKTEEPVSTSATNADASAAAGAEGAPRAAATAEPRAACACKAGKPGGLTMEKSARIKALIESKVTPWTEADQSYLETQSDERLTALEAHATDLTATAATAAKTDEALKVAETAVAEAKAASEKVLSEDEYLAKAPESVKQIVASHKAAQASRHAALVGTLKTAQAEYTEDELKAMDVASLERLARVAKAQPEATPAFDFSGRGTPRAAASAEDNAVPPPPDVTARIRALRGMASA